MKHFMRATRSLAYSNSSSSTRFITAVSPMQTKLRMYPSVSNVVLIDSLWNSTKKIITRQYGTSEEKVPKELIKQIREETAAPLGQILKALKETNNNVEEAKKRLRELGVAIAAHKSSRAAKEGVCGFVKIDDNGDYVLFEVNCETDFVARGEEFGKLVQRVREELVRNPGLNNEQLAEIMKDDLSALTLKVGENISIARVERFKGDNVYVYLHNRATNGQDVANSLAIVELDKPNDAIGTNLAMHICGMTPIYTSRESVPETAINEERMSQLEIFKREQEKLADELKEPADKLDKILNKRIEKWLKEVCLLEQSYLLQPSKTIAQILQERGVQLKQWKRIKVGMRS